MTNRFYAVTVLFDEDIRADDAEEIINAIKMIKHVQKVAAKHVSTVETWAGEERARQKLGIQLMEVLYPVLYPKKSSKDGL